MPSNHRFRSHHAGAGQSRKLVTLHGFAQHHECNFKRILPSAMDKLVADGLFEPWEGTYRITEKGKAVLKDFEK